jgi:hypothetical protein
MTGLPDGSIVLLANSRRACPSDGGGGLYWHKPGASAPLLLHDFPGLKPEGVTPAADGKAVVLVFDNDLRPRCGHGGRFRNRGAVPAEV